MKEIIDQIKRVKRYGLIIDGEKFRGEPTQEEIADAVDKRNWKHAACKNIGQNFSKSGNVFHGWNYLACFGNITRAA